MKRWITTLSLSALNVFLISMAFSSAVFGFSNNENQIKNSILVSGISMTNHDSIPFAKVILYRPENQLSRKYKLTTNLNGSFEMGRKEVITMEAHSNTFNISVDAVGHKKAFFTFNLSQNKVHYFRIQDRNNYSGFYAFLEVIEVTEETFKRETF
jgi:hypothetical protein